MRLHVEISASSGYWDDDKLRRKMKIAVAEAVNLVIGSFDNAELYSLKLVKPAPQTKKKS